MLYTLPSHRSLFLVRKPFLGKTDCIRHDTTDNAHSLEMQRFQTCKVRSVNTFSDESDKAFLSECEKLQGAMTQTSLPPDACHPHRWPTESISLEDVSSGVGLASITP